MLQKISAGQKGLPIGLVDPASHNANRLNEATLEAPPLKVAWADGRSDSEVRRSRNGETRGQPRGQHSRSTVAQNDAPIEQ